MIEVYFNLVKNKRRTCNPENKTVRQVPEHLKNDVIQMLQEEHFGLDGNKVE